MGLDAVVYCNCFESGNFRELPPFPDLIFVASDGSLDCRTEDPDTSLEFDQWLYYRACVHENGVLIHRYIGNIARVSYLSEDLSVEAEKFSIILNLETVKKLTKILFIFTLYKLKLSILTRTI